MPSASPKLTAKTIFAVSWQTAKRQQTANSLIPVVHVPLLCDNESAIKIAHNPIQHSRTKHIDVRHHFIRDHVAKGDIDLNYVRTDKQVADIFTKSLDEKTFCRLRSELNILDVSNVN